jgi:methionine transaminase
LPASPTFFNSLLALKPDAASMIISKLPNVGTTIFTRMSQLAAETGALNLSQGFPDFDGPQALRDAVGRHIAAGHNQYAPMTGLPALREQVAAKIARSYGRAVSAEAEVTIVPGATQGIFCAVQALIRPGDEVIVFDPSYDSYEPSVELAGGRCVHVPLALPDFAIDWQRLQDALSDKTRLIILNSPHNPSGALISRAELDQLAALIRERDIYLISDEVYEHLVFDGLRHASVLAHEELYAACLCGQLVRQDLPRHRLEDRLCGGTASLERRAAQGPSVRQFLRGDAAAMGAGGLHG